ncbi:MAG: phospholipid carrier-dependent glycosyltransferase [Candidatus Paceibacterota bacterium]|jgi:dolichyl-phosphate-mannose-protein mannosyltransferase
MKWYVISILFLSALCHFIFFGHPPEVVFDEVHFGRFSSAYETGEFFFDIHPPLGKLLISTAGHVSGFEATSMNYDTIGNSFTDSGYVWYRILPILSGLFLPLVIFFLCLKLSFSKHAALFAALAVIFENSLLVQSRFIFLDSFLLLFGFSALLFYFTSRNSSLIRPARFNYLLSAIFVGLAVSVKWTGLSFLAIIILVETWRLIRNIKDWSVWKKWIYRIFSLLGIVFVVYYIIFAIHFTLLSKSGTGDAFMSAEFQKTLIGSKYESLSDIKSKGMPSKFIELNIEMYKANKNLTATHDYSSKWYSWPFMQRPIYYWVASDDSATGVKDEVKTESKIYLLGNPLVYWSGAISVVLLALTLIFRHPSLRDKKDRRVGLLLLFGFLINWLPFALIGRVMFLYHYLAALIFSILIMAYLIDKIDERKTRLRVGIILIALFAIGFIFYSPLTYGLPMTPGEQEVRLIFNSWK